MSNITPYIYNFETSQKLTEEQLRKLNVMLEKFFMLEEDEELVPEFTTEIMLQE